MVKLGLCCYNFVKNGSFNRGLEDAVENGAPASQYKTPKIIRKLCNFMENSVVPTYLWTHLRLMY